MAGIWFLLYLYSFLIGCCVGSFLNVAALRAAAGESFVRGRSHCPTCGETLRVWDLVPLFSYLFLRGRCRYCHAKISMRYPLTEAAAGGLYVLCLWRYGLTLQTMNAWLVASLLLCVFLIDMQAMIIPNGLVLAFLAPILFDLALTGFSGLLGRVSGFFAVSLPLLLLTRLIPDCFGGGDIKLLAVCGFLLGWKAILLAAFFAVVGCGLVCMVKMALKKVKKGDHVAFGPYLAAGILAARLFYTPVMDAYIALLGL